MIKRPCHYYNTTGKCRFGEHCKFIHSVDKPSSTEKVERVKNKNEVLTSAEENTGLTLQSGLSRTDNSKSRQDESLISKKENGLGTVRQEKGRICRYYVTSGFCCYGDRCKYQHILSTRTVQGSHSENENVTSSHGNGSDKCELKNESLNLVRHSSKSDVTGRSSRNVCRFYRGGHCNYGDRCKFYHPADTSVSQLLEKPLSLREEKFASTSASVVIEGNTKADRQEHVPRAPFQNVLHIYKRGDVAVEKLKELRETELKQLKRRFPAEKLKILSETDNDTTVIFSFIPSDPDWPFDVRCFDIQVSFDKQYPLKLFSVDVPLDQDLPATLQRYIKASLQEWITKKEEENIRKDVVELLFRPFLRWLDRSMENIVTEGLRQLRRELTAKAAGLQFVSANELQMGHDHETPIDKSLPEDSSNLESEESKHLVAYRKFDHGEDEDVYTGPAPESHTTVLDHTNVADDSDDGSSSDDSGHKNRADHNEDKVHERPPIDPDTGRRGTEMSFRNMQLWHCTTILVEKLHLVIHCDRCKNATDFSTQPNRVNSIGCSKCNHAQLVVFRPLLSHAYSSTFGYLDLEGCLAFDIILQDCYFSVDCSKCSRHILVKSFTAGRVMEIRCRGCHTTMKFTADSVKLLALTADGVDSSQFSGKIYTVKVRKSQRQRDPAIQEGKPLPDNGACKHYKKSYRWLRFPCCGKAYPCDVCHDSKEDHEMLFANRMICGFCCKEQPYAADKPCVGCSSSLARVRTAHWEGGHGCRDKITMSRSDKRKYSNLHKTLSNKAKTHQEKNKGKKNTKLRHT